MKLVIAIVQDQDTSRLIKTMMKEGFSATRLSTTGGFLRAGNTTLLIGVEEERVDTCLEVIERVCKTRTQKLTATTPMDGTAFIHDAADIEIRVGGATVFILPVDEFKKL